MEEKKIVDEYKSLKSDYDVVFADEDTSCSVSSCYSCSDGCCGP